ncbi:MAG: hypothetical protein MZW92_16790, partial [Comamonadaceae bacterium]|nr:hypothetical protein [Comamonadaceae bacterium]
LRIAKVKQTTTNGIDSTCNRTPKRLNTAMDMVNFDASGIDNPSNEKTHPIRICPVPDNNYHLVQNSWKVRASVF